MLDRQQRELAFDSHAEATRFAKKLANCASRTVCIKRCNDQWLASWTVLVDRIESQVQNLLGRLQAEQAHASNRGNFDIDDLDYPDDFFDEVHDDFGDHDRELDELRSELLGDQDDWARSHDEGWYYDDD